MPGRGGGAGPTVVGYLGEDVEVQALRLMDELEVGKRRGPAVHDERVEPLPGLAVGAFDLGAELVPSRPVVRWVAAERGWEGWSLQLERVARHDPDPRRAVGEQCREAVDVVLDDDVGLGDRK